MLFDFFKNIPLPHSNSMMGFDDSVDGPIVPLAPILVKRKLSLLSFIIECFSGHYLNMRLNLFSSGFLF